MAATAISCACCNVLKMCFPDKFSDIDKIATLVHGNKHISELTKLCETCDPSEDEYRNFIRLYTASQFAHGRDVSDGELMLLIAEVPATTSRGSYFWAIFRGACKRGCIETAKQIVDFSHLFVKVSREAIIRVAAEYQNAQLLKEISFLSDKTGKIMDFNCAVSAAIAHDTGSLLKDFHKLTDTHLSPESCLNIAARYGNIISASYILEFADSSSTKSDPITDPIKKDTVQVAIDNGQYEFAYKFIKQFGIKLQDLKLAKDTAADAFMHRLLL